MMDDLTMPVIAIGGGFTLLFVLACILIVRSRRIARRRKALLDARKTSFHMAVIVPDAAFCGRAAFEDIPSPLAPQVHAVRDDQLVEVVPIPAPPSPAPPASVPVSDYTTIGYAPRPPVGYVPRQAPQHAQPQYARPQYVQSQYAQPSQHTYAYAQQQYALYQQQQQAQQPPMPLVQPPAPRPDMRVRMHYLGPREQQPRMARGSTPGIVTAPQAHTHVAPNQLPARPAEWDVSTTPGASARTRVYRRQ